MPTYALLGATGSTGAAVIRPLLRSSPPHSTLNLFVRSSSKLRQMFPGLESNVDLSVQVFDGSTSDMGTLQACLENVDLIFACIGSNYSTYGQTTTQDTATAVIDALEAIRVSASDKQTWKAPTVIQLRSDSLNATLSGHFAPWYGRIMADFCFYYNFEASLWFSGESCQCFVRVWSITAVYLG